jgi:membrane protein implicated in regulation of membrane protease activity
LHTLLLNVVAVPRNFGFGVLRLNDKLYAVNGEDAHCRANRDFSAAGTSPRGPAQAACQHAAFLGAPLNWQLYLFIIMSVLVLVFGRPFFKKRLTPKKTATNVDALIGESGTVTEEIGFDRGRVQVGGLSWAARVTADDLAIPAGSVIRVLAIDGVKLIVEPQKSDIK